MPENTGRRAALVTSARGHQTTPRRSKPWPEAMRREIVQIIGQSTFTFYYY